MHVKPLELGLNKKSSYILLLVVKLKQLPQATYSSQFNLFVFEMVEFLLI